MATPFFRGPIRVDLLIAAEMAGAAEYSQPDSALAAFKSVEDASIQVFPAPGVLDIDVYVITSVRYCCVVFQGTQNSSQWTSNVLGSFQAAFTGVPGKVNTYWAGLANRTWNRIKDAVLAWAVGDRGVVWVGHSLGGACGQIVAKLAQPHLTVPHVLFVFGCPRVGDPAFAGAFDSGELCRVEAPGDVICNVPPPLWAGTVIAPLPVFPFPAQYRHGGNVVSLSGEGEMSFIESVAAAGPFNPGLVINSAIAAHDMRHYVALLRSPLDIGDLSHDPQQLEEPQQLDIVLRDLTNHTHAGWGLPATPSFPLDGDNQGGVEMWRATFMFKAGKFGWSETYYRDGATADEVADAGNSLMAKRLTLCGGGVSTSEVRVSDTTLFRDFGLFPLTFNTSLKELPTDNFAKPFCALLVNLINGPYRNRIFLRGAPQGEYLGDDPLNVSPAWKAKLKAFGKALKDGQWKMRVQKRFGAEVKSGVVQGATNAAPIVLTVTRPGEFSFSDGQQIRVRQVKGNKGANGLWYVAPFVGDANKITLKATSGTGDYLSGGVWRLVEVDYPIIQSVEVIREVSHRTGRPSDAPAGRRPAKKAA